MNFKLGGKDMLCPDTIGNWSKAGTANDGTSPFYKRNPLLAQMNAYDHITIPWRLNLVCDGYIHYTAKGLPEYVLGYGNRYRVFKFDFEVTNSGGPRETNRGGLNKDRAIFIFKGDHAAAEWTNTPVGKNAAASAEWGQIKNVRKVFDSVQEFWGALLALQPPAPPTSPFAPAALWERSDDHWLLDRTYYGPPSSRPARVLPVNPMGDLESRLETAIQDLKGIAEASGLRLFILARQYGTTGRMMVTKTLRVAERLAKSGYRLRVIPLFDTSEVQDQVRIHYY